MKGNDGTGNTVERDVWQTPQKEIFEPLDQQYKFDFDCCADKTNRKTSDFSNNFLRTDTCGFYNMCWMNPPFSKAYEMFAHYFNNVKAGVCIYRCDNMETKLWQEVILKHATWVLIPPKRICYEGFEGMGARFASALIGFNVEPPKNVAGIILMIYGGEK